MIPKTPYSNYKAPIVPCAWVMHPGFQVRMAHATQQLPVCSTLQQLLKKSYFSVIIVVS